MTKVLISKCFLLFYFQFIYFLKLLKLQNLISFNGVGQDYYLSIGILKIAVLKVSISNKEPKNYKLPISFQNSETYGILVEPNKNLDQKYNSEYGIQTTRISGNEIQVASNYLTSYGCRLICIGL